MSLLVACAYGHTESVRSILQEGANPDENSLILSARVGVIEIVRLLLQYGADASHIDVLTSACVNGNLEIVRLLLQHGGNINEIPRVDDSPLCSASRYGHLEVVRFLLQNGANLVIDHGDPWLSNCCALGWATQNGHVEVVRLLLQYGADPNRDGGVPLDVAIKKNRIEVIEELLYIPAILSIFASIANEKYLDVNSFERWTCVSARFLSNDSE